jgi:hypothetical protein
LPFGPHRKTFIAAVDPSRLFDRPLPSAECRGIGVHGKHLIFTPGIYDVGAIDDDFSGLPGGDAGAEGPVRDAGTPDIFISLSPEQEGGGPDFPSGSGAGGGDFVARFTVDSRMEIDFATTEVTVEGEGLAPGLFLRLAQSLLENTDEFFFDPEDGLEIDVDIDVIETEDRYAFDLSATYLLPDGTTASETKTPVTIFLINGVKLQGDELEDAFTELFTIAPTGYGGSDDIA